MKRIGYFLITVFLISSSASGSNDWLEACASIDTQKLYPQAYETLINQRESTRVELERAISSQRRASINQYRSICRNFNFSQLKQFLTQGKTECEKLCKSELCAKNFLDKVGGGFQDALTGSTTNTALCKPCKAQCDLDSSYIGAYFVGFIDAKSKCPSATSSDVPQVHGAKAE